MSTPSRVPVRISLVSFSTVAYLTEHAQEFPGVEVERPASRSPPTINFNDGRANAPLIERTHLSSSEPLIRPPVTHSTSRTSSPPSASHSRSPAPPSSPRIFATYARVSGYGGMQPQRATELGPAL